MDFIKQYINNFDYLIETIFLILFLEIINLLILRSTVFNVFFVLFLLLVCIINKTYKINFKLDKIYPSLMFIFSKVFVIFIMFCFYSFISIKNKPPSFLSYFFSYDGLFYNSIAERGYYGLKEIICFQPINKFHCFFPLYPLVINIVSKILIVPITFVGFFINFILNYISTILMYEMTNKNKFVILIFLFNPLSLFFIMTYTESLFFFLTLISYYFYKKGNYIASSFFIGLSCLTRNTGFIFAFAFFIFAPKIKDKIIICINTSLIGFLYPVYTYITTGDFFAFIHAQKFFGRTPSLPITPIITDFKRMITDDNLTHKMTIGFSFIILFYIFILIYKKYKIQPMLSLIICIVAIYPLTSMFQLIGENYRTMQSESRFLLGLFPTYLLSNYNTKLLKIILILSLLFLVYVCWSISNFYYID